MKVRVQIEECMFYQHLDHIGYLPQAIHDKIRELEAELEILKKVKVATFTQNPKIEFPEGCTEMKFALKDADGVYANLEVSRQD